MFSVKFMQSNKFYYRFLLTVWLLLCVYVLVSYLLGSGSTADSEFVLKFYLQMSILTFPFGYVAGLLVGALFDLLSKAGIELPLVATRYASILLAWFAMAATGFLQWFFCLPKLFAWIKALWKGL